MKIAIQRSSIALALGSLCCLAATTAQAKTPAQIIQRGDGFKKLRLDDPTYRQLFDAARAESPLSKAGAAGGTSAQQAKAAAPSTGTVVQLTSLRGARDAGLPTWLQQEILEDAGYAGWGAVPASALDQAMDTVVVDLDAVSELDAALPGAPAADGTVRAKGIFDDLVDAIQECTHKKVKQESRRITQTFDERRPTLSRSGPAQLHFEVDGLFRGKGTFTAEVHYTVKTRCSIPYGAQLDHADLIVDADLDGEIGVVGSVEARYQGNLIDPLRLELWRYYTSWWAYIFELNLELKANLELGVKLEAEARASLGLRYETTGKVGMAWRCTSSGCDETRSTSDVDFELADGLTREVLAKVRVVPYVDTSFTATLGMYANILELAKGKLGIVAALPVSYFAYTGNLCSDADGDGVSERANARLIDGSADLYAYLDVELGNKSLSRTIDLGIFDFGRPLEATLHHDERRTGTLYRKSLFYRDLASGGSSVVMPVLGYPDELALDGSLQLGKRSCYPFDDAVTFELDFGDGSPHYVGPGGSIPHRWAAAGSYQLAARMLSDAAGRSLQGPWVTVQVAVDTDGESGPAEKGAAPLGDVDGDGCVDDADYELVMSDYGAATVAANAASDLDRDGSIDVDDYLAVLQSWGAGCR